MSKIDDGGPAYPGPVFTRLGNNAGHSMGLTLRDWFAGQALAGRMARNSTYFSWEDAAKDAYEAADAMLQARKEKEE